MTRCEVVTLTLNPAIDQTVTIPSFAAGAVNRVERVRQDPGGKGVNVASALADAGHRVAVTGFLGRDNAVPFETLFAAKGIDDHFVRIAGQTRVGIKIVDPLQQQTTDLNFPGQAPTAADCAELVARLAALDTPWVVMAGSVPPGVYATAGPTSGGGRGPAAGGDRHRPGGGLDGWRGGLLRHRRSAGLRATPEGAGSQYRRGG
jgi:1-phosphofructokinase